jgi:hypothetical protein
VRHPSHIQIEHLAGRQDSLSVCHLMSAGEMKVYLTAINYKKWLAVDQS